MNTANEIRILRVANGFAVELPRPMPYYPRPVENPVSEQLKAAMPFYKELIRLQHADPQLDKLLHPEEEETPQDPLPDAEPVGSIGLDPYTHIFSTWSGVMEFLANLVF